MKRLLLLLVMAIVCAWSNAAIAKESRRPPVQIVYEVDESNNPYYDDKGGVRHYFNSNLAMYVALGSLPPVFFQQTIFVPTCAGDATADTARFNAIKSAIGAANTGTIKIPYKSTSSQRCKLNTFASGTNIAIDNTDGSGIFLVTGQTITVNRIINAPDKQIFYNGLGGQGTVGFSNADTLYPDWWAPNTTPGTTDMTTACQAAIDACLTGGTVSFRPVSYKITTALVGIRGIIVRGYGATLDISALGVGAIGLSIEGALTPTTTTTFSALALNGATSLSVASSLGFTDGDLIEITSTERFTVGSAVPADANYKKGELAFIDTVPNDTTINLRSALKEGYAVAGQTVTVTLTAPISSPKIFGLKVVGNGLGVTQQVGINVSYATAPTIQDVSVVSCGGTGVNFTAVDHGTMVNSYVENVNDTTDVTGYAYSFSHLTQHSTVSNCRARRSRHGFTTGSYYPVWFYSVIGNAFADGVDNVSAGILTHLNGSDGLIVGNTVDNMALGITVLSQRNVVANNIVTNAVQQGITVGSNAAMQTLVVGNKITAAQNGIAAVAYDGGTQPNVDIRDNLVIGATIDGNAPGAGITVDTDYANVSNNTVRGFGPGVRAGGSYQNIENNDILDVLNQSTGAAIRVFTATTITGVRVRNNRVKNDTGTTLAYGVYVDAGAVDTLLEGNDLRDPLTANILDLGIRTVMKRNILDGRIQSKSLVVGTAGLTNATTAGKIKTVNNIVYELSGATIAFNGTDNFWQPSSAANTTAGQFRKILLGIDSGALPVIIYGQTAASQAAAKLPNWDAWNVCPVGYLEIPNNYAAGSALTGAGFTYRDFPAGKIE